MFTGPDSFFFHRLLKLKTLHANRAERTGKADKKENEDVKEIEIESLPDALEKLTEDELWKLGSTATEFVPESAIEGYGLGVTHGGETDG